MRLAVLILVALTVAGCSGIGVVPSLTSAVLPSVDCKGSGTISTTLPVGGITTTWTCGDTGGYIHPAQPTTPAGSK